MGMSLASWLPPLPTITWLCRPHEPWWGQPGDSEGR